MSTIVEVIVNRLPDDRLIEFGVKLGDAKGWIDFYIVDEAESGEDDYADYSNKYARVAVTFETKEAAQTFASRFTSVQESAQ